MEHSEAASIVTDTSRTAPAVYPPDGNYMDHLSHRLHDNETIVDARKQVEGRISGVWDGDNKK